MKIIIRNFQNKIAINPKKIKKAVFKILSLEKIKKTGEVTFCFINDRKIKKLNLKYLGKNRPTDVLAFDITADKGLRRDKIFADIVISTDRAIVNARTFKAAPLYELYLYIIHGLLHILGYDDKTKKNRLIMRKKEEFLIKNLKLKT